MKARVEPPLPRASGGVRAELIAGRRGVVARQDTRQAKIRRDEPSQEGGPTLIENDRLETPSESQQTTKASARRERLPLEALSWRAWPHGTGPALQGNRNLGYSPPKVDGADPCPSGNLPNHTVPPWSTAVSTGGRTSALPCVLLVNALVHYCLIRLLDLLFHSMSPSPAIPRRTRKSSSGPNCFALSPTHSYNR